MTTNKIEYNRQWRLKNKEKHRAQRKRYSDKNKGKIKKAARIAYLKNKEVVLARQHKRYAENKELISIKRKARYRKNIDYVKKYSENYRKRPHTMFLIYRASAKKRKINYELTEQQFMSFLNKPCFYCGAKIQGVRIDRVDNQKGYVLSNVVSCCTQCNSMKLDYTQNEFYEKCFKITQEWMKKKWRHK